MNASSPLISLDHVGKTYASGTTALDGVSADIAQGAFVSLVGPSGCGKSTLLRILAGLISADRGSVAWPATGTRPRELGFVFQEATLMPWASVFDNVRLPLKLKSQSSEQARERVISTLSRVGLADFADAFPRELSGGMRMRVSIARALVTEPPVLLMDEPFAALDEFTRETLDDDLIALWHAQAWTVLFVTHSIYEAVYLSERVLVMGARPGRIVADVAIEAPAERGRAFRESHLYIDQCAAISAKLREAS
ncbi:ABC transporter ATP-binding protein [Parvibaculum sp. MBR-TMA-1.3b-4.2]|jgi:NitT/TauT family transport system ATP-binding protein